MKKHLSILFLLFFPLFMFARNEVDSLLKVLDNTIKEHRIYEQKKELRIDSLKLKLNSMTDIDERYHLSHKLFREYRNYNMDSALYNANQKLELAEKLANPEYIRIANMNIAEILGIMGLYKESLDIMGQIDKNSLDDKERAYSFHIYHSLYTLMSENSFSDKEKSHYKNLLSQYKDSLLQVNSPGTLAYSLILSGKLEQDEKWDEALDLMLNCYAEYGSDPSQVGTIAYGLSEIYRKKGDYDNSKKYLVISAIGDQQKAAKSYISLRKLAILLYEEGDIDRAYTYIKRSMEDAILCKARFRMLEISQTLPIIVAAYDKKVHQEKTNLINSILLISVLVLILIFSIIYIFRQLKKLSRARKSITSIYHDMKVMNTELQELNDKLAESNHVKEEYIGFIFNLCSSYIDKMESYRVDINRKLKTNMLKDALKLTGTTLVTDEVKEFYRTFDAIFLNIYPNFIDDFNNLLMDDAQIVPKAGDILTSELRVFALMRLGISDSSKIASFLHYSPQTVYNYKLKIRNKLKVSKDEFAFAIQQVGR